MSGKRELGRCLIGAFLGAQSEPSEDQSALIWKRDIEGRYTYLSAAWEKTLGYTLEEMTGRHFSDFQTPESVRREQKGFATLLEQDVVRCLETVHLKKDGSPVNLVFHTRTSLNDQGQIVGTEGLAFDKTSQQLIENQRFAALKALEESEQRYRALTDEAADGIFIVDQQGNFIDVNIQGCAMLGYIREDVLKLNFSDVTQAEDQKVSPFWLSLPPGGGRVSSERRFRRKDGSFFFAEINGKVFSDGRVQGIVRDITKRKLAEQRLAEEKERLAVTLRSIGDGVITCDVDGRVSSMSLVAEKLTGWPAVEAHGKMVSEVLFLVERDSRKPFPNLVEHILKADDTIRLELPMVLISRDGTERMIEDSGSPIKDTSGNTIGVVLVFRDVTEKMKLLEAAQNRQKLDSLGALAAGIAHDFNNLLGGIYGFIDLAKLETSDPVVVEFLEKSLSTIHRARSLTQKLLTFATGGAPRRRVGRVDNVITGSIQSALAGTPVSSGLHIDENLWECKFDEIQLGQVIENIVANAQQAMPLGGKVDVTVENFTLDESEVAALPAGPYLRISIKDSGVGIPKEVLQKIYDPFFTTKDLGRGLGLATSYSIIKRHGGAILAESEPGIGSTFHLFLPAYPANLFESEKKELGTFQGQGTVLLMDDEEVLRETYGKVLQKLGYSVLVMSDGEEVLSFLEKSEGDKPSVSAIILDLTVPGGLGGMEIIPPIREKWDNLPVIVTSGYADDPVMADPCRYGFTASLKKPFRMIDLAGLLARLCSQPSSES